MRQTPHPGSAAPQLPILAAGTGVLGCVAGDLLISAHALAQATSSSSVSVITDHSQVVWELYKYQFDFLSAVFYVLAGFAGFRLATQHGLLAEQGPPTEKP